MMKNNSHPSSDSVLQLRQKLIHYKSEINHYEQKIKQYERALEQEKENTDFWKEKHTSMIHHWEKENSAEEFERKINMLTNELAEQKLLNEHLKKKLSQQERVVKVEEKRMSKHDLVAFFMYSVITPYNKEEDTVIVGNVIIKNQTSIPLHSPTLCLKILPPSSANLSGKIKSADKQSAESFYVQETGSEQWEYAHPNWKEKIRTDGEYWLKPVQTTILKPDSVLSFDSFQLGIRSDANLSSFLFEGYFYTKEWQEGIPFLNKIVVNFSA
ncbi:molybdopterin synthase catalytic subunit [Bacillus fengqiuensis]|nr:molybdopterin synthase catalytic subunit [Bacillus fengqiuensis]